jgi:hypothetical protein
MARRTETPDAPSLERFRGALDRLVEQFARNLSQYKSGAYRVSKETWKKELPLPQR